MINLKKTLFTAAALTATGAIGVLLARPLIATISPPPADIGILEGKLAACPDRPNCVSSQTNPEDTLHYIHPITYTGTQSEAKATLLDALHQMKRMTLVANLPDYIYAEFRSPTFHFIDDAEFYFDNKNNIIHVRSAARLGYGDLGVNRYRLRSIKNQFYSR